MLNFGLILLLNLFLRRARKQHKQLQGLLSFQVQALNLTSALTGTQDIIRCARYIFRKEISNGRGVCMSNVPICDTGREDGA